MCKTLIAAFVTLSCASPLLKASWPGFVFHVEAVGADGITVTAMLPAAFKSARLAARNSQLSHSRQTMTCF
jgi:hypothetical protein